MTVKREKQQSDTLYTHNLSYLDGGTDQEEEAPDGCFEATLSDAARKAQMTRRFVRSQVHA